MNTIELKKDITALLHLLQTEIDDDYRATDEDTEPGMQVTIACNDDMTSFAYQTGDNSYTGSCYFLPHWAVTYLYRNSDCKDLANDIVYQLVELITDNSYEQLKNKTIEWN